MRATAIFTKQAYHKTYIRFELFQYDSWYVGSNKIHSIRNTNHQAGVYSEQKDKFDVGKRSILDDSTFKTDNWSTDFHSSSAAIARQMTTRVRTSTLTSTSQSVRRIANVFRGVNSFLTFSQNSHRRATRGQMSDVFGCIRWQLWLNMKKYGS